MKYGKQIGKGAFTTAYQTKDNQVLLLSTCYAKECMALGWGATGRRWPNIERLDYNVDDKSNSLYKMPLYNKITAPKQQLNAVDYKAYLQARKVHAWWWQYSKWDKHEAFKKYCSPSLADQFIQMLDGMHNYTDQVGFECSPRNVAITKGGGLIWLDLFYSWNQLYKRRQNQYGLQKEL